MEDYIKQEQKDIAQKVISYYEQKVLETSFDLVGLGNVEWRNFKVGNLFDFDRKPSKGLNNLEIAIDKGISYLGATNRNNGVLEFVEPRKNLIYKGNCIAFIRNGEGSMGYSIYKKEDFIATQDISVGYNTNLDRYNGMFLTTIADRVRGKYNFGYKRNQIRLENEILTLPADENSNPHWDYMSKFMKKLEAEKLEKVLEYI
ncbi:MAG: restriction endonuclease subunit S [Anaerococcus sp.]|nr:restriction endonuclease subunit S [Anaerococcus sp.]